jgi:hypothetical protein
MNGDIQEMLDALKMAENAEKLKGETAWPKLHSSSKSSAKKVFCASA